LSRKLVMLAALLVTGILVHRGFDDWYRHTVHRDSLPERRARDYAALDGPVDTLVYGDSHALSGVDPRLLGAAYTVALPGQFPPKVHGLLATRIAQPGVRRVVLQADLHTFWAHPERWLLLRHYAPRVDYAALGRARGEPLPYLVRGLLGRFAPYVAQREMVVGYLADGRPPELAWIRDRPLVRGAVLSSMRWLDRPAEERARLATERVEIHFRHGRDVDAVALAYFRRALEVAREAGVGVVVVSYPVSPAYLAEAAARVDVAGIDRRLGEVLAAHPEVRRLDARSLFLGRASLFADPDHLNHQGARALSRRIRAELDALGPRGA